MNRTLDKKAFRVALATAGFRSCAALARAVNLNSSYVRTIGNGLIPPEHTRTKIAAALGVRADLIWTAD